MGNWNSRRAVGGFAVVGFLVASAAASDQAPTAPASGNATQGKELYPKYSCYACHGHDGHTGPGTRLVPMRMTLPPSPRMSESAPDAAVHRKVLSDAQAADLWAFIKSIPESPAS